MASLYCTGPAHCFVAGAALAGLSGTPVYLGTCEQSPQIQLRPTFDPVFNDLGGRVPFDETYGGEEGFISLDLTRWNEAIYAALATRTSFGGGGATRGTDTALDVGTLMITELKHLQVWIQFPFVAKPTMQAAGLPAGYRFAACVFEGPDDFATLGTRARKLHVMFHALRTWSVTNGAFMLYDHNMTGLPIIN